MDFHRLRSDFPFLQQTNRGKPIVYLDSSGSAQKPKAVVDALSDFYYHDYANIHRGIYELSERASHLYESAREAVKTFMNAAHKEEIVFVRGTTEAINLVAQSYGKSHFKAGDEIIISTMEHHSNIVPWTMLRDQIGVQIKVIPISDNGELDTEAYEQLFSPRTKLVAVTQASNVLGTINPVRELGVIAHQHGVPILVDGAQAMPHMPVDVQLLDCDFYVFSAHKLYGPTGIGVLYAKKHLLQDMPPYQGGGGMIETVSFEKVTYAPIPFRFEAGTPHIAGAIGLHAALDYVNAIGMQAIYDHEQTLLHYANKKLNQIDELTIIGNSAPKLGVISFVMDHIHPHDIGTVLDHEGVAVRAGHHCAMPLMERYQIPATVRASFGIYNNEQDIDQLIEAILLAKRIFA
jgi:cysteine desulfurase/selenocysteine lyase